MKDLRLFEGLLYFMLAPQSPREENGEMTETLRFETTSEGISAAMPMSIFEGAIARRGTFAHLMSTASGRHFVSTDENRDTVVTSFDAQSIATIKKDDMRDLRKREFLESLNELQWSAALAEQEDPRIRFTSGLERRGYGVYGMEARLTWPEVSDHEASVLVTRAMRTMAKNLRMYEPSMISDLVGGFVSREQGMTFETNPAGACSMDTDGFEYRPGQERVRLYPHNLYTHDMQLTCIAGMIAVARAETP